ncbi:MAG: LysM peptidoglycan-binding domain-containing protein [Bacteroidales bacterium]|nr:LysM peptidoglycan-binding domain-containing protein [Bacteroidales bacterium]MCF8403870.1 LysM peptidoglycan-binding domain-containing protein [Bacteroidales bacterium]
MKIFKNILFLFLLLFVLLNNTKSQQAIPINKSSIIENINGSDYYIHFVKKGETLFAIARAYGITVDDIFKSNPMAHKGINENVTLKIPLRQKVVETTEKPNEISGEEYFYYIVKKKETKYGISKKFGVSIDRIHELNPELGEYPREGETLKIPLIKEKEKVTAPDWKDKMETHQVVEGETLYQIARQYEVSIGEIKNANPGLSEKLAIGERIYIPNQDVKSIADEGKALIEGSEANQKAPLKTHTVSSGETLYSIGRMYATSVDSLKKFNPYLLDNLYIGQEIKIPPVKNSDFILHKSDKKSSLKEIADLYQVDYNKLAELNPGVFKKTRKGQDVKIPVENKIEETEPIEIVTTPDELLVSTECGRAGIYGGKTFNIALMLPFFLQEYDSLLSMKKVDFGTLSNLVSFRFLDFYGGFKMAVDSMAAQGMKTNLFIYDVDNDQEKIEQVLLNSELGSMDLIVGPLYRQSFQKAASFAKSYKIPIINPLSTRSEILLNNPYVFKIKPDESFQLDILTDYILNRYPDYNIVLLRNNKYKYQKEISFIRNTINSERKTHVYLSNQQLLERISREDILGDNLITESKVIDYEQLKRNPLDSTYFSNLVKEVIYVNDSAAGIEANLSLVRDNIVIAVSDDIVFSKEVLSQLNKLNLNHKITLFGLPNWNEYTDLETSHLLNLNLHCLTVSLVDYKNKNTRDWISKFRNKYHTEPSVSNFAFDGFDIGWYFLNALYHYGPSFSNCLEYNDVNLIQGPIMFKNLPESGYTNTFWNIGAYKSFEFQRVDQNYRSSKPRYNP